MTEDMEFPQLTPSGDRLPSGHGLFRRPEDLTDEQFDLLAAAWADDALSGDSLAETEEAITASSERRVRAESFRQVRLSPLNERWEGSSRMLKAAPGRYAIRRALTVTLAVAAALGALVILRPFRTLTDSGSKGPAVAEVQNTGEALTTAETEMTGEALIPGAVPVIKAVPAEDLTSGMQEARQVRGSAGPSVREPGSPESAGLTSSSADGMSDPGTINVTGDDNERSHSFAMTHDFAGAVPILAAGPEASRLMPVELRNIIPMPVAEREENWIVRGLSLLAEVITKEPKRVDGYYIASACVNGVNRVLGWEMELEQEKGIEGEPLATSFSSSLLTFSAPAKKSNP